MRLSRYFLPILKENPREAEIVSHRLMVRAGMIRQQGQGSFSWLPLGKRVLDKVCRIVREEQNRAGALEILMPTIQSAELWRESGRYDDYGKEMLRIKDRHERDMLFGPTNEEMVTGLWAWLRRYPADRAVRLKLLRAPCQQMALSAVMHKKNARREALQFERVRSVFRLPAAANYRAQIASSQDFDRAGERIFLRPLDYAGAP